MSNEELWAAGKLPELWEAVKRLLYQMAWKFHLSHEGTELEDLRQECYFAFLRAVKAYKPEKGYRFNSYLSYAFKGHFQARERYWDTVSLNQPLSPEEDTELGDTIPDPQAEEALEAVENKLYFGSMIDLSRLPFLQQEVLRCRFGNAITRPQVAQALHITSEDVRREEAAGLRSLREIIFQKEEYLQTAAYKGTGWNAWYYEQGSVEERTVEALEEKERKP